MSEGTLGERVAALRAALERIRDRDPGAGGGGATLDSLAGYAEATRRDAERAIQYDDAVASETEFD